MNNFNFKSYDNSKQTISYCEVDKCPAVIKLREQLEAYKMEAEEGKEINAELKAENEELKKCYKNNSALLDFEETNTTKLVNKVMKLEQTLTEIKEIAETQQSWNECNMKFTETESEDDIFAYNWSALKQILQKISECEATNER